MTNELRDAALGYLARGWSVIPGHIPTKEGCSCHKASCSSPGKHPRIAGYHGYEAKRASTGDVETWWTRWPEANVIVVTGAISGIVVVDVDPRHGGDDSLHDLALPETLNSITGSLGRHLYYLHPGVKVRNSAGEIRPGIDFRGDGGYVVAPPSLHASGREYAWDLGGPQDLAPFPDQLGGALAGHTAGIGDPGLPSSLLRPFDLSQILARRIPHGERNDTLARIAGHFAGQGDDVADMILKLHGINMLYCVDAQGKTPDPLPAADIERIARSIYERERERRDRNAAVEAALEARRNGQTRELGEHDRLLLARQAWADLGVGDVVEWALILGQTDQYVLSLPDEEVPLGGSLYSFKVIRDQLLNRAGKELLAQAKEWPRWVVMLRSLVHEEHAEPTIQAERVGEWVDSFCGMFAAMEVQAPRRREALRDRAILYEGRVCLSATALREHVEHVFGEQIKVTEMRRVLLQAGWERRTIRAGGGSCSVWFMPAAV